MNARSLASFLAPISTLTSTSPTLLHARPRRVDRRRIASHRIASDAERAAEASEAEGCEARRVSREDPRRDRVEDEAEGQTPRRRRRRAERLRVAGGHARRHRGGGVAAREARESEGEESKERGDANEAEDAAVRVRDGADAGGARAPGVSVEPDRGHLEPHRRGVESERGRGETGPGGGGGAKKRREKKKVELKADSDAVARSLAARQISASARGVSFKGENKLGVRYNNAKKNKTGGKKGSKRSAKRAQETW